MVLNPLEDTDLSGLLQMRREDIPPQDGGFNLIPDSQRTYAEVNGTDVLRTNIGSGNDVIHAGAGDDVVNAGAGDDTVFAGSGVDIVAGYDGEDFIEGGDDADRLYGDYQADSGELSAAQTLFLWGAPIVTRIALDAELPWTRLPRWRGR